LGRGEASCRQFGGNSVQERFHRSLKCEHLCRRKAANAPELAKEVAAYVALFH
jgi:hypothetical protein